MDIVQTVEPLFQTIDNAGFWRGTISPLAVSNRNRDQVVETPLPDELLSGFEKWRWVNGAWVKCDDLRGHTWYDPLNTDNTHEPAAFDDAPPSGWTYWAPGQNPNRTQAELTRKEWAKVRERRSTLLAATDWIVIRAADRGEPVPTDWQTYRQALRDVTGQADPFNIVWPTPPT